MHALTLIIISLLVFALAYRFYAKFIITKILVFDDSIPTPAHTFKDGRDYHPTNKFVLFGHHFAAISGACLFTVRAIDSSVTFDTSSLQLRLAATNDS